MLDLRVWVDVTTVYRVNKGATGRETFILGSFLLHIFMDRLQFTLTPLLHQQETELLATLGQASPLEMGRR